MVEEWIFAQNEMSQGYVMLLDTYSKSRESIEQPPAIRLIDHTSELSVEEKGSLCRRAIYTYMHVYLYLTAGAVRSMLEFSRYIIHANESHIGFWSDLSLTPYHIIPQFSSIYIYTYLSRIHLPITCQKKNKPSYSELLPSSSVFRLPPPTTLHPSPRYVYCYAVFMH